MPRRAASRSCSLGIGSPTFRVASAVLTISLRVTETDSSETPRSDFQTMRLTVPHPRPQPKVSHRAELAASTATARWPKLTLQLASYALSHIGGRD